MPRYVVALTEDEICESKGIIQKGGKGYRIKRAQILLKLDYRPENDSWTYDCIQEAYGANHNTIAGIAKRFVMEGMEAVDYITDSTIHLLNVIYYLDSRSIYNYV